MQSLDQFLVGRTQHNVFWRWLPFAACLLVLLTSTHIPPSQLAFSPVLNEVGGDKTAHVIVYLVLTFTLNLAWPWRSRLSALWMAAALLLLAAADELTQPLLDRQADLLDWLADGVGIVLGIVFTRMDPQTKG